MSSSDPITDPRSDISVNSSQSLPSSSQGNGSYAFITHSQETLPLNLPPTIDNATLARRRRRRTSARDQAILEEEYRLCDRPDKPKRKEITEKVDMGEREVQIWFQNKRQSARRKSKPLLRTEFTAQGVNSILNSAAAASVRGPLSSDPAPGTSSPSSPTTLPPLARHSSGLRERPSLPSISRSTSFTFLPQDLHHSMRSYKRLPLGDIGTDRNIRSDIVPRIDAIEALKAHSPRPNLPRMSTHEALQAALSSDNPPPITAPTLMRRATTGSFKTPTLHRRSSSFLRLSTSIDGKASIIPVPELTPDNSSQESQETTSPTSPGSPIPPSSSVRSAAIVDDENEHPHAHPPLPAALVRRSSSKTSSKVWEFLCDNRGSGEMPQPEEATTALSLMRAKEGSIIDTPTPVMSRKRRVLQQVAQAKAAVPEKEHVVQRKRKFAENPIKHARTASTGPAVGTLKKKRTEKLDKENFPPAGGVVAEKKGSSGGDEVEVGELLLSLRGGNWGSAAV